ncbi:sterol O-acyltransferase 2 isoform X2 [Folsomia candida]|uniref:sterol O-acyltransferase 2 isoform X2 n=1 Tax=Folsomia candida TaxID=158441 RepID=UPI00160509D2|nr:sterol O-acyltransferase 2 isoform X2 [Folsomia candida]
MSSQRTMVLDDVRSNTKKLKSDFLGQMEHRLSAMIDDVMDNLHKTEYPERVLMMSDPSMMRDKRKATVPGKLPEKEFRSRPSLLTEMLEVPHIRTIHHIFIAVLCLVMLHTILTDIIETNTIDLGIQRLMDAFYKPLTTLRILISIEFFALFLLFPSFYLWSTHRLNYNQETRRMIDYGAVGLFATFLVSFMYFPARALLQDRLIGPASSCLVAMEQCRLLMKMWAFVRHNVPKALMFDHKKEVTIRGIAEEGKVGEEKDDSSPSSGLLRKRVKTDETSRTRSGLDAEGTTSPLNENLHLSGPALNGPSRKVMGKQALDSWISWDDKKSPCPSFSRYLYFYLAPTLIYKDQYPRSSTIRWNVVCWNFAQVFGCIFYANMVVGKACALYFSKFGLPGHPMTPSMLCNAIFSLMLPGILGLVFGFYLLLHSWHNAFAEMLRFGDRLFYKDWWNRSSFSDYYKTWNLIVHDWLYTYVFKDAWESGLGRRYKVLPTTLVFLVSSVFHEYILAFSLNFFLPVLFILFGGFGFALYFKNIEGSAGNVFMWVGLTAGTGIIVSTYSMEYFARINCPTENEGSVLDFFIPRTLSCGAFQWSQAT